MRLTQKTLNSTINQRSNIINFTRIMLFFKTVKKANAHFLQPYVNKTHFFSGKPASKQHKLLKKSVRHKKTIRDVTPHSQITVIFNKSISITAL